MRPVVLRQSRFCRWFLMVLKKPSMSEKSIFHTVIELIPLLVLGIVLFTALRPGAAMPVKQTQQIETRLSIATSAQENKALYIMPGFNQVISPSQSYILPGFVLPYSSTAVVYWTGGPHEYGNLNRLGQYQSGLGSGLDFAGGHFEVLAMATGTVEEAYCMNTIPSLGCIVAIRHFTGNTVLVYAHLLEGSITVQKGERVSRGDILGKAGSTGTSDNVVHLHIELRDGSDTCTMNCLPGGLGGNPIGWDDLIELVDGYYIGGYLVDSEGLWSYNYDGSAVKGDTKVIYDFRYLDQPGDEPRSNVIARVNTFFDCPSELNNCEINDDPRTQFAGNGIFDISHITSISVSSFSQIDQVGRLLSTNIANMPSPPMPPADWEYVTFISDITLPDHTVVSPGAALVKTWLVRNSGTSTWDGYKLIFVSGDQMSAPSPVDIPYTLPGAEVDISIPIVVPQTSARGDWQIVNTSGTWVPNGQLWMILDVQGTEPVVTSDIDLDCVNNTCYATVAPGQTFRPTIRATVNNGQLLEARGDMLRLKDGDLYGAWPHVAVQGTVNTGQSYDFTFYADNPIQAPSQEGTYQNTWQVWRDGNWAGEEFILQFTVSQSGGGNRPPNRPDPASPNDWTVYYSGNTATLCAQANGDPDGDAITGYYFDVYESAQLWNSGWVASNCVTTGAFSPYGYQWRVKVRDSHGAESEWSDTWHFTLVDQNLTITGPTFEPLDGQSEVVRIRACTDGQGGVGITLRVSVNSANDGSENGEWHILKELGVPCFNEVDAPTWNTLEYEGGPHLVRVEAHGSNTGWDGATVAHGTFTVPSNHRPNSPVILPNLDERYFDSPTIHLDSVTSLRTTSRQIVASINSDYSSPLIDEPITYSATGYTYTLDAEYARIYWRITATGPYGSNTSSFETHIDMTPPDSQVSALPPVTTDTRFTINWSGSDARAGLRWYHIQVRDAGRPDSVWEDWLVNTTKTAEIFQGQPGHTYAFRARAMDSIGNWENWPAEGNGDTYTLVDPSAAPPTAWWDTNYAHKRNLVILNNDSDTMPTGFPLHIHFDTTTTPSAAEIYNASLSAIKGDDVRVVYDNQTELNRFVQRFTTAQIDLWFPLQAALGGGQTNTGSYQLYYASAVAGTPPTDINTVFLPQVDSNTMGMWHFQEGAGNTVTDSSGRGHHGYFYNAGWGDGYLGNTGVFNGTSAYVEIPHSDDFKPGAITLEAWIYLDRPLSYTARIFTKSRYEFRIHHDGNLQFVINAAGGDRTITGQAKIYSNQWYHVAATYDGGTRMRLYVNGVLDKEENFGAPPENWNDHPLRIGREPYDFTSYFPGYIQHARISNVERTNFSYGRVTASPSVAAGLQLDLEATGTPDLAILDLTTYPNTGGGLLVLALVENQGDAPTQNNFYTDLYVDHLPTGTGDYTGSLQFWVNSPITAGAHITLTTVITDLADLDGPMACALAVPGSEVTATLYTQVDSAGVISETDNSNNISMGTDICFASSDAYENMTTDVNLLSNAGFEQGDSDPFDWETSAWQYDPSAFTWDTTYTHNGMRSAKIANTTPNDAMWLQTVAVQSHTDYRLSGWIKTENVTHTTEYNDAGANLSLYGTWERTNGVFGSQDWTYVSLNFNSGDSLSVTVAARLGYWSGTITGTAWFDDLHLAPLGETISGDDTVTNAQEIAVGEVQVHNMDSLMDQDWLKFQAQGGVTYTLSTFDLGTAADTYLYLYDTDGTTLLAANDDYGGSLASRIDWTAPTTSTYYLLIQHWNPNVGGCGTAYTVSVTVLRPDTTPPTGRVTSPSTGAVISVCPLTIQAEVSDAESGVDFVEFHAWYDGNWHHLGNDSTSPYSWSWDCAAVSSQEVRLTIHAWDNAGNEIMDPGGYVYVTLSDSSDSYRIYLPVILSSARNSLPSDQATIFDGGVYYEASGFSFCTNTVVGWNSSIADLLAAKSSSMSFFLPYDAPPYSDGDNARAGIIGMAQTALDQVSECPESGYQYHWVGASSGNVYCVRTRDGAHYAVIKVTAIDDNSLTFTWVYQPNGSRRFD